MEVDQGAPHGQCRSLFTEGGGRDRPRTKASIKLSRTVTDLIETPQGPLNGYVRLGVTKPTSHNKTRWC